MTSRRMRSAATSAWIACLLFSMVTPAVAATTVTTTVVTTTTEPSATTPTTNPAADREAAIAGLLVDEANTIVLQPALADEILKRSAAHTARAVELRVPLATTIPVARSYEAFADAARLDLADQRSKATDAYVKAATKVNVDDALRDLDADIASLEKPPVTQPGNTLPTLSTRSADQRKSFLEAIHRTIDSRRNPRGIRFVDRNTEWIQQIGIVVAKLIALAVALIAVLLALGPMATMGWRKCRRKRAKLTIGKIEGDTNGTLAALIEDEIKNLASPVGTSVMLASTAGAAFDVPQLFTAFGEPGKLVASMVSVLPKLRPYTFQLTGTVLTVPGTSTAVALRLSRLSGKVVDNCTFRSDVPYTTAPPVPAAHGRANAADPSKDTPASVWGKPGDDTFLTRVVAARGAAWAACRLPPNDQKLEPDYWRVPSGVRIGSLLMRDGHHAESMAVYAQTLPFDPLEPATHIGIAYAHAVLHPDKVDVSTALATRAVTACETAIVRTEPLGPPISVKLSDTLFKRTDDRTASICHLDQAYVRARHNQLVARSNALAGHASGQSKERARLFDDAKLFAIRLAESKEGLERPTNRLVAWHRRKIRNASLELLQLLRRLEPLSYCAILAAWPETGPHLLQPLLERHTPTMGPGVALTHSDLRERVEGACPEPDGILAAIGTDDPQNRYALACVYAQRGGVKGATFALSLLERLETSIRTPASTDPFFDSLRRSDAGIAGLGRLGITQPNEPDPSEREIALGGHLALAALAGTKRTATLAGAGIVTKRDLVRWCCKSDDLRQLLAALNAAEPSARRITREGLLNMARIAEVMDLIERDEPTVVLHPGYALFLQLHGVRSLRSFRVKAAQLRDCESSQLHVAASGIGNYPKGTTSDWMARTRWSASVLPAPIDSAANPLVSQRSVLRSLQWNLNAKIHGG